MPEMSALPSNKMQKEIEQRNYKTDPKIILALQKPMNGSPLADLPKPLNTTIAVEV